MLVQSCHNHYFLKKMLQIHLEVTSVWFESDLLHKLVYACAEKKHLSSGPHADVFAYAGAQVKKSIEVTQKLGGLNYVFWGGREGYHTLRNTNLRLELDNMARFLALAVKYKKEINFKGNFLLEPKPQEPTKHQVQPDCSKISCFDKIHKTECVFLLILSTFLEFLPGA